GAGGVNDVYNAPEDDLVLGVSSRGSALIEAAIDPATDMDLDQVQMIGGTGGDPRAWTGFGDVVDAYETLADASGRDGPTFRLAHTVGGPEEITSGALMFSWACDRMELPGEFIHVADDGSSD